MPLLSHYQYKNSSKFIIFSHNKSKIRVNAEALNNTEYPAEILGLNPSTDLAILKINYGNPYHFKIGDFNAVNLGDKLSILGFPLSHLLGSDIRYTEGSVSARSGYKADPTYFQHSAPTQPGNSGGPILNGKFEVIGVAASVLNNGGSNVTPQNVNFGIKSGYIGPMLNHELRPGNGNVRSMPCAFP